MKLKIHKFEDGRESYSTGNITGELNGMPPVETKEVEISEEESEEIFNNPKKFREKREKEIKDRNAKPS